MAAYQSIKLPSGQVMVTWTDSGNSSLVDFIKQITADGSKVVAMLPLVYYQSTLLLETVLIIIE